MKPKLTFYLALILGILIIVKAIYDATNPAGVHNSFATIWDLVIGALLLSFSYRSYKKMKAEENY